MTSISELEKRLTTPRLRTYSVTGTFHGSIVQAKSEGDARRAFHQHYNGESITHVKDISNWNLENL